MSGDVILFAVISIVFLVAIVFAEVCRDDAQKKTSAENKAEVATEKFICRRHDYIGKSDGFKKAG